MSSSDRSGTSVGRYRLVRLLGRGGMGEVYEAHDTEKDRDVAVKLLPPALADDADFRARFMRESQTVAKLNDPHIIPIHDFGEVDGQLFLDMRIVRGRDLRSVLRDGPLSPDRAVSIVDQVASALDTAHRSGLLHRDVKPENILLDDRGFVYLADFGLAQAAGQTRLTSTGTAIGSFAYMAPERFGTDTPVGPGGDVYALACVLYECLVGTPPFSSTSIEQIIAGHLSRPIPLSGTAFDPVIASGLAKNPASRFASAGLLAAAARDVLAGRSSPGATAAHAPTMIAPIGSTPGPAAPTRLAPSPSATAALASSRRPALIAGSIAATAVIAAGAVAWAVTGNGGDSDPGADVASAPATVTVHAPAESTAPETSGPETSAVEAPEEEESTQARPTRGTGDLGLAEPISTPACDGTTITVVENAATPASYRADVAAALAQYPGSSYLRTDQTCLSLKQSEDGHPIYAVYYPGSSLSATCATKRRLGGVVYTRRLDNVTPVGTEIC